MARAFTLMEVLMVVIITPILMVSLSGLFRSFLHDVPRTIRLAEQNSVVLIMLDQLGRDMDDAVGLPEQVGDTRADGSILLIRQEDAVLCYRFEEGRTRRTILSGRGTPSPTEERVWQARDAVVEWQPWMQEGRGCGVEVHSHLKQQVAGELRRKFRGSYVFYVRNSAEGGLVQ